MPKLNDKDLTIIEALDKYGSKTSTKDLSKKINIPPRTIRYRLSKLRERGFLTPYHVLTHERKLGVGENIIVLRIKQEQDKRLKELFDIIPCVYNYTSTYGKYDGYVIRSLFSLNKPNTNFELLDALKRCGYISDFYIFELVDYLIKSVDLTYFNPDDGWIWDWNKWLTDIENCSKYNNNFDLKYEEKISKVEFDYKDILLIDNLLENATITLKQLKNILNLSETQISKRIQRLQEKGIIKGYKSDCTFADSKDLIHFYCFLEITTSNDNILSYFYQLPYQFIINIESSNKLCLSFLLRANDFKNFLKGFDLLRTQFKSSFFQILHKKSKSNYQQIFSLFNKYTNSWEIPIKDYISLIEKGY